MRVGCSILKMNLKQGLQYRTSAISGLLTQVFFGFMQIGLYTAFLNNGTSDFTVNQMASYIWLQQIFFTIFKYWDGCKNEITRKIVNGDIAYQLIRPLDLYKYWYTMNLTKPFGHLILRGLPMMVIALVLPAGIGLMLPSSFVNFLLFMVSAVLGALLVSAINTISHIIVLYTLSPAGIFGFVSSVAGFFSGMVVPIPMLPEYFQKILNFLPFRYVNDLPYRLYIGDINGKEALWQIGVQIIWTIALILLGKLIVKRKVNRLVVQGG